MEQEKTRPTEVDCEKAGNDAALSIVSSVREGDSIQTGFRNWLKQNVFALAEARGIVPVPLEERTDTKGTSLITLWFTANLNLLPVATGMSGTYVFGLSFRDSALIILFFTMLGILPVAWLGTLGPKTGLRQMIQARLDFARIVVLLQLATLTGYILVTAIISGQTLAAVSDGAVSTTVGIVITAVISLAVSFMGYSVLHVYERYSWISTLFAIIVTVGVGSKGLALQTAVAASPSARTILSFGSACLAYALSWIALVSDFSVYISPTVPKHRTFLYVLCGYCVPSIPLLVLGAAMGGAVSNNPSWAQAAEKYSAGGTMYAMVATTGGFGKFIAVLLAFSVIGNTACSLYGVSISFQVLHPWLAKAPRYVFTILVTAIVIPMSIVAASNFYASLSNFLGVIGYWTATYTGVALTEHHWFRRGNYDSYDQDHYNDRSKLPVGIAAIGACISSFGLIIPCVDVTWYTGPIAMVTGDLGIETGIVLSIGFFVLLRTIELKYTGR